MLFVNWVFLPFIVKKTKLIIIKGWDQFKCNFGKRLEGFGGNKHAF